MSMGTQWQKSTFSTDTDNCLELAAHHRDTLLFRESESTADPLAVRPQRLGAFLTALKCGTPHLIPSDN